MNQQQQQHDIGRWREGFPRSGWKLVGFQDLKGLTGECEACGTAIRYEHEIQHPERVKPMTVGVVCCEHLTGASGVPTEIEKEIKAIEKSRARRMEDPLRGCSRTYNRNYRLRGHRGIVIYRTQEDDTRWKIRFENEWLDEIYDTPELAATVAWQLLYNLKLEHVLSQIGISTK